MLVLSRKIGEVITIGSNVRITVLSFDRGVIRLGIEAPKEIAIHRKEVYDKIIDLNIQSSQTDVNDIKNLINDNGLNFENTDNLDLDNIVVVKPSNKD